MNPFPNQANKPENLRDLVKQIQDLLFSGQIRKGDRLPSERDLAGIFHTSRPVVREALRILETKGLIHIEKGRAGGIFVSLDMDRMLTDHWKLLMQGQIISLNHLVEVRRELEGRAARNAALKAKSKDLLQLELQIEKIRQCTAGSRMDVPGFIKADTDFHLNLSMIDGNPCNTYILQSIYNLHEYFDRFIRINRDGMKRNLEDLSGLFEAVLTHRAETAEKLAVSHIDRFNFDPDFQLSESSHSSSVNS